MLMPCRVALDEHADDGTPKADQRALLHGPSLDPHCRHPCRSRGDIGSRPRAAVGQMSHPAADSGSTAVRRGRRIRAPDLRRLGVEGGAEGGDEGGGFLGAAAVEQPAHERAADDHAVGAGRGLRGLLRASRCRRRAARACRWRPCSARPSARRAPASAVALAGDARAARRRRRSRATARRSRRAGRRAWSARRAARSRRRPRRPRRPSRRARRAGGRGRSRRRRRDSRSASAHALVPEVRDEVVVRHHDERHRRRRRRRARRSRRSASRRDRARAGSPPGSCGRP